VNCNENIQFCFGFIKPANKEPFVTLQSTPSNFAHNQLEKRIRVSTGSTPIFEYGLCNGAIADTSHVYRKSKMAAVKIEAAITVERLEIMTRFNC